jgi:hypothetical protein
MDPDPGPGPVGPKTSGFGSPTLLQGSLNFSWIKIEPLLSDLQVTKFALESHFLRCGFVTFLYGSGSGTVEPCL